MTRRNLFARWRADPISFIERILIDPETGKPFVLLDAERVFLSYAFATDADGQLLYPEQVYACPKKSGKTTFAALYTITAVLLYGGRYAEAVCAANDYEQSVGRVFTAIKRIVECSPLLRKKAKITVDKVAMFGTTIRAISNNYASAAGSNHVLAVFDELWGYASERARRLFDELVPPPTRRIAARLTVTYAGFEGESTLLEDLYRRGLRQPKVDLDLYAGDGILMFWTHEPVAPWQTAAWRAQMRRSLRPSQYARMIENRFVFADSPFIDRSAWDRCVDERMRHVLSDCNMRLWVGVDASIRADSTAIVATTWDAGAQQVRLVTHTIFRPDKDNPLNFEATIKQTLLDLHTRFSVRKVLYDPCQMIHLAQELTRAGLPMEEFPSSPANLTAASQNLFELIRGQNLLAYPDSDMRRAVSQSVAVETSRGWRITKSKRADEIDVVVALAMAAYATIRGYGDDYDYSYRGWDDLDWQGLRLNLYVSSGGRIIL